MSENRSCLLTVDVPLRIVCAGTLKGGDVNMVRHRLTDPQWELVQDLFPPPARTGRPRRDRREILDGVLWILRTGAPWRDLPEELGPWPPRPGSSPPPAGAWSSPPGPRPSPGPARPWPRSAPPTGT